VSPKRGSLSGMLGAAAEVPPMPARPAESQAPELQSPEVQTTDQQTPEARSPEVQSPGVRKLRPRRPQARAAAAPAPEVPKYLRLERKEALIWPDQLTQLSILARILNRAHGGAGERITANTLIRVAIALLLSRGRDLSGATEEELRRSLGLPE
jgi:hypothetical protein